MPADATTGLFAVITDFNGFEQTRRCLAALRASHERAFGVVVVDHGTTDATRDGLQAEFPEVTRITASPDLWWTGATNRGIAHALDHGADAIMLLNNDCYVAPDTIGTLTRLSRERPDSIIAPMQRDWRTGELTCIAPRTLLLLGFPTWKGPTRLSAAMQSQALLPVTLVNGGRGVIIPATVFAKIGVFDETCLPHYGADHDFYIRARKSGIALYTATGAVVEVDQTRTSLASDPGRLTLHEFLETLHSVRSHRNIPHMKELFRRHYPVRHLHLVGVALYAIRYLVVYVFRRGRLLLANQLGGGMRSPR